MSDHPDDPYAATREQTIALWDVADGAKKFFLLQHNYKTKGTGKRQAEQALVELGRLIDVLDHMNPKGMRSSVSPHGEAEPGDDDEDGNGDDGADPGEEQPPGE